MDVIVLSGARGDGLQGHGGREGKRAAAFGACLGDSFGGARGNRATWTFEAPAERREAALIIRYANGHDRAAAYRVLLNGRALPAMGGAAAHALAPTGGWGDRDTDWACLVVRRGVALRRGLNRLTLIGTRHDNHLNVDLLLFVEPADAARLADFTRAQFEALAPAAAVDFDEGTGTYTNAALDNGVPFGGIGAGKFEIFPDGWIGNLACANNWDCPVPLSRGSFFAVQTHVGGEAHTRLLRRRRPAEYDHARNIATVRYRGLLPTAALTFEDADLPVQIRALASSALVPQDIARSSLPGAGVVFTVANPGRRPVHVHLMAAWENVAGVGGYFSAAAGKTRMVGFDDRRGHRVLPFARASLAGVRLLAARRRTGLARNAEGEFALAVERTAGLRVGAFAFDAGADAAPALGAAAEPLPPGGARATAGGVTAAFTLAPGARREVRFHIAWHMPHQLALIDRRDHGHAYAARYRSAPAVAARLAADRGAREAGTREWQELVRRSSLPFWLQYRLINGAFPAFSNTLLTRRGHFAMLESPVTMKGALGTMDQRMASHGFWTQMFTDLDRRELDSFARCQQADGRITHFTGNVHHALENPAVHYGITDWPDLSSSWILQLLKQYRWTGDRTWLKAHWPRVRRTMRWLIAADRDGDGIPEGGSTYDYEKAFGGAFAYTASCHLGAMRAVAAMADALGDAATRAAADAAFARAQAGALTHLWNGRYFRKSVNIATGARNENSFIASLAGDWLARLCGLEPIYPVAQVSSNLKHVLDLHVQRFPLVPPMEVTPEGAAAVDDAYVLQHEPFLGMEAMYAGFPREGLDVLQRVYRAAWPVNHVGWRLPLNFMCGSGRPRGLWTYMTATSTWHVLNALTGATLDLPAGALYFQPADPAASFELPLFFPHFWLWASYDANRRRAQLKVLKVLKPGLSLRAVRRSMADGSIAEARLRRPFAIKQGAVLTLRIAN